MGNNWKCWPKIQSLMGPPMVPECLYGVPGEGWGWAGWVGGLFLDFRPTVPVVIIMDVLCTPIRVQLVTINSAVK